MRRPSWTSYKRHIDVVWASKNVLFLLKKCIIKEVFVYTSSINSTQITISENFGREDGNDNAITAQLLVVVVSFMSATVTDLHISTQLDSFMRWDVIVKTTHVIQRVLIL